MAAVRGLKDQEAYAAWAREFLTLPVADRPLAYLRRYPHGTTLKGMLPWMGLGTGQKARRQLDGMLRRLEDRGAAKVWRAGEGQEIRMWAWKMPANGPSTSDKR